MQQTKTRMITVICPSCSALFEVKVEQVQHKTSCYRCSKVFFVEAEAEKEFWRGQPILSVIAFHQQFIDKTIFDTSFEKCKGSENKNKALLNYFEQEKILTPEQSVRLKELFLLFVTPQEDIRFGALCVRFNMVSESNVQLALDEQNRLHASSKKLKLIGDFLVEAGMITERQRSLVILKQRREKFLRGAPSAGVGEDASGKKSPPVSGKRDHSESPDIDYTRIPMKEISQHGLCLRIQHDGLKAYLIKSLMFDKTFSVSYLEEFLKTNGIVFGVSGEPELRQFLEQYPTDRYFMVASGKPPVESIPSRFEYTFDHDYLKAGHISEDGTIDFKERGTIPEVSEGSLLVTKTPMIPGRNGTSIFGDMIAPVSETDQEIMCGQGVRLSADQCQLYAAIKGFPKIEIGGRISVVREYIIQGDVDYSTGHIDYDGNVIIEGAIRSGFRVKAHDVIAESVEGGGIISNGDITIAEGITKASISARGNISALFVHHSSAQAFGSIIVKKEILDSSIITNGSCVLGMGRILASSVCAKLGIRVHSIGTEHTKQSTIIAGISTYTEEELSRINMVLENQQKEMDNLYLEKDKIDFEIGEIINQISESETACERSIELIRKMETSGETKKTEDGRNVLDILRENTSKIEARVNELSRERDRLENESQALTIDINLCSEKIKQMVKEMLTLRQIDHEISPNPTIEIEGKIMPGTKVGGRYSNTIIKETLERVRIKEIALPSRQNGEPNNWMLEISRI